MTRNVVRNTFIDAGLLIIVVGLSMGLFSDAINSSERQHMKYAALFENIFLKNAIK